MVIERETGTAFVPDPLSTQQPPGHPALLSSEEQAKHDFGTLHHIVV